MALLGSNQDSPDPESSRPADLSDKLLGFGHFLSIGLRIPAVVCPVLPGETMAKPRRSQLTDPTFGTIDLWRVRWLGDT